MENINILYEAYLFENIFVDIENLIDGCILSKKQFADKIENESCQIKEDK